MKKEVWKDIFGNNKYFISNYGRIKNNKNHIIKTHNDKDGYQIYSFYINSKKITKKIHRLVAQHFIFNPNNYEFINHKDENKSNNYFENLEWCTKIYNTNYGNARLKQKQKLYKPVICIELNKEFESIKKAANFIKRDKTSVCDCCNNKRNRKTCGGYHWKYKEEI